jgi:hypothetical protein
MVVPSMAIHRTPRLSASTVTSMVARKACTSAKYAGRRRSSMSPPATSRPIQPIV